MLAGSKPNLRQHRAELPSNQTHINSISNMSACAEEMLSAHERSLHHSHPQTALSVRLTAACIRSLQLRNSCMHDPTQTNSASACTQPLFTGILTSANGQLERPVCLMNALSSPPAVHLRCWSRRDARGCRCTRVMALLLLHNTV